MVNEFLAKNQYAKIAFCIVDNTHKITNGYTKEIIKNISDFTISNIVSKDFDVFQGLNEDQLLNHVANLDYHHAVVLSTGTEFINGFNFFSDVVELCKSDNFIVGHILDRGEAYYELHHQCYLINLIKFNEIGCPKIGQEQLSHTHIQSVPIRTSENIHDDYTPLEISKGNTLQEYKHKLHGHNLISVALEHDLKISAWTPIVRNNKKYYYPENESVFLKELSWAVARYAYCMSTHVHTEHTETMDYNKEYEQIITPASGYYFTGDNVVMYDYNSKSLEFFKDKCKETIHVDLLGPFTDMLIVNQPKNTLVNFSNIFNYEGTMVFSSLKFRLFKENEILSKLPHHWDVLFTQRSCLGFCEYTDKELVHISKLKKPTWHMNGDWE